jgi:hypothetical protein
LPVAHAGSFWAWVAVHIGGHPEIEWLNDDGTVNPPRPAAPHPVDHTAADPRHRHRAGSSARLLLQTTPDETADIYVTRVGWGLGAAAWMTGPRPVARWCGPDPVRRINVGCGAHVRVELGSGPHFTDFDVPTGRLLLYAPGWFSGSSVTVISPTRLSDDVHHLADPHLPTFR